MIDLIGWIGNLGFIIGTILISYKKKQGFIYSGGRNLIYLYLGLIKDLYSLVFISGFLIITSIFGYYKWTQNEKTVK